MPIVNCFIKNKQTSYIKLQEVVKLWSRDIMVDEKHISLTVLQSEVQVGKQYEMMIHLILPSIWEKNIKKTQLSLVKSMAECLNVKATEIFLFTSIINSGNVIENGGVIKW